MAKCKNCGSQIAENCTVCSTCGQINPIKTKKVKTTDMTMKFQQEKISVESYRPKRRKVVVVLFFLLGFTAAPYFYLRDMYRALVSLVSTFVIIGAAFLMGYFVFENLTISLIVGAIFLYSIHVGVGIYYLRHHEIKDGKGEFLV